MKRIRKTNNQRHIPKWETCPRPLGMPCGDLSTNVLEDENGIEVAWCMCHSQELYQIQANSPPRRCAPCMRKGNPEQGILPSKRLIEPRPIPDWATEYNKKHPW